MAKYKCKPCGFVYEEEKGLSEKDIKAGTKFADLPKDFKCPVCGVGKEFFEKVEE